MIRLSWRPLFGLIRSSLQIASLCRYVRDLVVVVLLLRAHGWPGHVIRLCLPSAFGSDSCDRSQSRCGMSNAKAAREPRSCIGGLAAAGRRTVCCVGCDTASSSRSRKPTATFGGAAFFPLGPLIRVHSSSQQRQTNWMGDSFVASGKRVRVGEVRVVFGTRRRPPGLSQDLRGKGIQQLLPCVRYSGRLVPSPWPFTFS